MKILFDTNVLVAALITVGTSYDVIEHAFHEHEIYYTPFIINEIKKVFRRKFHYPEFIINEFLQFINRFFIKGNTSDTIENVCRDSVDNQLLADAVVNNIDVIISGDKDLLDLKNYKGIKIISPTEYWRL